MAETVEEETVCRLRAANREELSSLRKKDRENVLKQKRLKLCEMGMLVSNVTKEQFQENILKLKQKKELSLKLLKIIKNACQTPSHSDTFFKTDGAFDCLVRVFIGRDAHLQLEAAACLTNLACSSHKASQRIAKAAGAYLVSFITGGSHYLQDQSAWAAGNIANDCIECYTLLKAQGLLPALLTAIKSTIPDVIQSAIFALHACTKYGDPDLIELAKPEVTRLLIKIIEQKNIYSDTNSDAAFALANICYLVAQNEMEMDSVAVSAIINSLCIRVPDTKIDILISSSVLDTEMDTLIVLPFVRCLGFLSTREKTCLYLAQHQYFYNCAKQILLNGHNDVKREILWVLTNIAVHYSSETVNIHIVHAVINVFLNPVNTSVLQALYYLCILASQNKEMQTLQNHSDFTLRITTLLQCGEKAIQKAAEILLNMLSFSL